jgi:phage/plasmid primase-like uncharacterized protein
MRADISQFTAAMRDRGLVPSRRGIVADGQFHRCDVASKGSHGIDDGSYVLHLHPAPFGGFINWTDGRSFQKWSLKTSHKLTAEEQREIERAMAEALTECEQARAKHRAEARVKAKRMWADAEKASAGHDYCQRKQVEPHGLRTIRFKDGGQPLFVPMRDEKGKLVNLQFIRPDGDKHGLRGGQQSGCHYWVAKPTETNSKTIVICEGWATGESIFQATEHAVIVAFNAGNLLSVTEWVHERYPKHRIVIAADDDWQTDGNPGLTKAAEAASAVKGLVAAPVFGKARKEADTDFNDMAIADGLEAVRRAIDEAREPDQGSEANDGPDDGDDKEKTKQVDALVLIASERTDVEGGFERLFHFEDEAYADLEINLHRETCKVRSRRFKGWLIKEFYERNATVPNATAVGSALDLIEAKAKFTGPERAVHVRIAGEQGRIYLDLCNEDWQCVEIDTEGWRIIDNPPVRFIRHAGMQALPTPAKSGSIEDLREFLNVDEDGFVLAVSWLVAALRDRGPYPVLSAQGREGSAKSTLLAVLRRLIDRNTTPLRAPPRDNHSVFLAAINGYVPTFDNLSYLPEWLSDTLARLSTGGGFGTRKYYTDDEERLFNAMRPILLGSIENVVIKGDLADRTTFLHPPPIPEDKRRVEEEFWDAFERKCPGILGALLDAVVHGLRELPHTKLDGYPRMADFAKWATACEGAMFKPGTFAAAYARNRATAAGDVLDADLVATAVERFMTERDHKKWDGRVADLLPLLTDVLDETQSQSKQWPKAGHTLSGRLTRAANNLRGIGIHIREYHHSVSRRRMIELTYTRSGQEPSKPSEASKSFDIKPLKDHGFEGSKASKAPIRTFIRAEGDADDDADVVVTGDLQRRNGRVEYRPNKAARLRRIRRLERQRERQW